MGMVMTPSVRKLALTVHVTASVGWAGALAVFLAHALASSMSQNDQIVRATAVAMGLTAWLVILPLGIASLVSGLVQALGTAWGLLRHYWVLFKLLLTGIATGILVLKLQPISHLWAGTQLARHARMRGRISTVIATLVLAAAVVAVAGIGYMYSGLYNVAATAPHNALSRWILETTQKNSVQAHAGKVGAPPELTDGQLRHGVEHFAKMCVQCHGAPGVERGELGKGITPTPPDLSKAVAEWSDQELYWIVKHGIKFAGMPAFGTTHSDEELWALVAFLKRLPTTTPEHYAQITARLNKKSGATSAGGGPHK